MLSRYSFNPIFISCVVCLQLLSLQLARAQSGAPVARKFDEFGDIRLSDLKAHLDNYAIQLQNEPNTRGFVLIYRSRRDLPGLSSRLMGLIKQYLVYSRGIPAQRLVTVDGGEASCLTQELWIVPAGATPTPRSDAYSYALADTESARKFDEYYYPLLNNDFENYEYLESGDSLEAFAEALRKEPNAQAYIIAYPQYYIERWDISVDGGNSKSGKRVHLDPRRTASGMLRTVKAELVNTFRIAPSRIKIVNGGYRQLRQIELWIVPRGAHAPIPTPNAFPASHTGR